MSEQNAEAFKLAMDFSDVVQKALEQTYHHIKKYHPGLGDDLVIRGFILEVFRLTLRSAPNLREGLDCIDELYTQLRDGLHEGGFLDDC